jgi:hypothetical protein
MLVWTKLNSAGKQQYATPGDYTMNSGPTAKWEDVNGAPDSSDEPPSLHISAFSP